MKEEEERFTFDDEILQSSTDMLREWLPERQKDVEQFLRDASSDEKKQWKKLLGQGKAKAKAKAKAKIKAQAKPKGRPKREPGPPERTKGVPSPKPAAGPRPTATTPARTMSAAMTGDEPAANAYRRLRRRSKGGIQWVKKEGMALGSAFRWHWEITSGEQSRSAAVACNGSRTDCCFAPHARAGFPARGPMSNPRLH